MKKRILAMILIVALSLGMNVTANAQEEPMTIRVGYIINEEIYPGFHFVSKDGTHSGYDYEYLQEIAQYINVKYEFIGGTWEECERWLKNGEIDLLNGVRYSEEKSKYFDYSTIPSGELPVYLYARKNDERFSYGDVRSLDGARIGICQFGEEWEEVTEFAEKNEIECSLQSYDSLSEMWKGLACGEIDVAYAAESLPPEGTRIVAKLPEVSFYLATAKNENREMMSEINQAMSMLTQENPNFVNELEEEYYSVGLYQKLDFTEEELAYLKEKGKIVVGCDPYFEPYEFFEDGELKGIIRDILDYFSECTGLEVEVYPVADFVEAVELFYEGKVDILPCVVRDYAWGDSYNAWLSVPVFESTAIYALKSGAEELGMEDITVALPEEYYHSRNFVKEHPQTKVRYYNSVAECLNAVRRGEADCVYADANNVNYYAGRAEYAGIVTAGGDASSVPLCMAISKRQDNRLLSVVNKVMQSAEVEQIKNSIYKYAPDRQDMKLSDLVYNNPVATIAVLSIFMILVAMFIIFFFYGRMVKEKEDVLKRVDKAKSDFLSNVSHELRTPLSAILGLNEMQLENIDDRYTVVDCAEKIHSSSKHLLALINDVLDLQKINEGKITIVSKRFFLPDLIEEMRVIYKNTAWQKGIIFEIQNEVKYQGHLMGDPLRIRQVLINLVSNAIKYNKEGGRALLKTLELPSANPQNIRVRFEVTDTGIGIEKQDLDRIFDEFVREVKVEEEKIEGTGLGLAISHKIVQLMGGTLEVDSEPGIGSSFWFELELAKAEEADGNSEQDEKAEAEIADACDLTGMHILVVEDNEINRQLVEYILKAKGAEIDTACDGQEAYEMFAQTVEGYYSTIVMDIKMPVMNGFEATERIRSMEREDAKRVRIIALSANAFDEDVQKAYACGMNAHCSKPIDKNKLYKAILGK